MKQVFIFSLLFLVFSTLSKAQEATGLLLEDNNYQNVARLGVGMNFSSNEAAKFSLRQYCPTPVSQGNIGSCVGWASGYGGMTVTYAAQKNITDKAQIDKLARSAMYIYNQIKVAGCSEGSRFTDAFDLLQNKGDCAMSDFSPNECNTLPTNKHDEAAAAFKIKDYGTLFEVDASPDVKISATIRSIAEGKPVIIGMLLSSSFKTLRTSYWQPQAGDVSIGAHAMLVVGYDSMKKTFEIMNSWGQSWGSGGFFTISYDNYAEYVKYGYQINIADTKPNNNTVNVQLSGDFVFNKYNTEKSQTENKDIYEEVVPTLSNSGYYTLPEGTCNTETYFQLVAKNIKKDAYVYVFSIKPDGQAEILYPSDKAFSHAFGVTIKQLPRVLANNVVITIPSIESNSGMVTDQAGEDHLCILYSDKVIDDIQNIVTALKKDFATSRNFNNSLKNVLADKLMPSDKLNYSNSKMSVKAVAANGYIAPIVLKVNVSQR